MKGFRSRRSFSEFFARNKISLSVLGLYVALYAIFFSPIWLTGRELAPGDGFIYYYPHYAGYRTLWDPLLATGYPAAADPQVMTWYLPSALMSLIPHSWNAFVILAYVLASWFTFLFVRDRVQDDFAALVSGVIYALSGFMIGHLGHTTIIHVAVWLPLILYCLERLAVAHERKRMIGIGAFAVSLCIFAGHLQIAFYILCFASVYALVRAVEERNRSMFVSAVLLFIAGLGVAAVQLLPTIELSAMSVRAQMTFETFSSYSMFPMQLITFLFPYIHGGVGGSVYRVPYIGPQGIQEVIGYAGTVPIVAGIAVLTGIERRKALFWGVIGIFALVLATSGATPVGALLYRIPVLNQFRAAGRFVLFADLAAAVLAGIGIAALRRCSRRRHAIYLVLAIPPALVILLAAWFWHGSARSAAANVLGITVAQFSSLELPAIWIPVVAACLVSLSLAILSFSPKSPFRQSLVLMAVIIEMTTFAGFFSWPTASPLRTTLSIPEGLKKHRDRLRASQQRWLAVQGVEAPVAEAPAELSSMWKIPAVGKYGPLLLSRYGELTNILSSGTISWSWAAPENRALDLMSTRLIGIANTPAAITWNNGQPFSTRELGFQIGSAPCAPGMADTLDVRVPETIIGGVITLETSLVCYVDFQGANVATIELRSANSTISEIPLRAGIETTVARRHQFVVQLPRDSRVKSFRVRWNRQYSGVLNVFSSVIYDPDTKAVHDTVLQDRLLADENRWKQVDTVNGVQVLENTRALPRAYLVNRSVQLTPAEVVSTVQTSRFPDGSLYDPRSTALAEEPVLLPSTTGVVSGSVRITHEDDTHLDIDCESDHPALLVVADSHYPGWEAFVNGKPEHVIRTNYIQRGVLVPAGRTRVQMVFRPRSIYIGGTLSALVAFALLGAVIFPDRFGKRAASGRN